MASQQHSRRDRRRGLNLAGALAIGVFVAAPSSALASTVASDGAGGFSFKTPVGETNDLTITQDATTLYFRDAGSSIQADPSSGCVKIGRGVDCPTPAPTDASALPLTILLGDGNDRLDNRTSVRTTVNGGPGEDIILGGAARDVITGAAGRDNIEGRDGNDYIDTGGTFPDTVACGAGIDHIRVDRADTVVSPEDCEKISFVTSTEDNAPTDTPSGTEQGNVVTPPSADSGQVVPVFIPGACANNITGTDRSDTLTGTSNGDNILALAGNDRVNAVAGDDCVFGGTGSDLLSGGSGRDFLSGESGTDRLSGSSGNDRLSGGTGSDRLSGGSGKDRIAGDLGHDVITGNGGRDHLYGGDGNDRMSGGAGIDRLYGGDGNDRLSGGTAVNVLNGGRGRDTIYAINGVRDRINCGSGRDVVYVDRRDRPARNCEVVKR